MGNLYEKYKIAAAKWALRGLAPVMIFGASSSMAQTKAAERTDNFSVTHMATLDGHTETVSVHKFCENFSSDRRAITEYSLSSNKINLNDGYSIQETTTDITNYTGSINASGKKTTSFSETLTLKSPDGKETSLDFIQSDLSKMSPVWENGEVTEKVKRTNQKTMISIMRKCSQNGVSGKALQAVMSYVRGNTIMSGKAKAVNISSRDVQQTTSSNIHVVNAKSFGRR